MEREVSLLESGLQTLTTKNKVFPLWIVHTHGAQFPIAVSPSCSNGGKIIAKPWIMLNLRHHSVVNIEIHINGEFSNHEKLPKVYTLEQYFERSLAHISNLLAKSHRYWNGQQARRLTLVGFPRLSRREPWQSLHLRSWGQCYSHQKVELCPLMKQSGWRSDHFAWVVHSSGGKTHQADRSFLLWGGWRLQGVNCLKATVVVLIRFVWSCWRSI